MNFIKKVFEGVKDDFVHNQFVRFGKGEYGGRAVLSLWKTKKIKVKSSFEYANDFVLFVANLENLNFKGFIWSKNEIEGLSGEKKAGKYIYEVSNFTSEQVKEFSEKAYYFLLNCDAEEIKLKIKKKLPKPGKGEGKVDDKFCQLELDEKYYSKFKEDFFWDVPEGKKIEIAHKFVITEIVMPKTEEKDFAKIREMALRKGKIIREGEIDGKEYKKEFDLEA